MIPTREDLIRLLTKEPQAGLSTLIAEFQCHPLDILRQLKAGDDFEQVAPRQQDGPGFAWRLSSLAADPRVRAAALVHQRHVEQPPQVRRQDFTKERLTPQSGVLVDWLRNNPGEWSLEQIATGRGVSIATVRCHLKRLRGSGRLVIRRVGKLLKLSVAV